MLDRSLACDEVVANVSWNRAATIDANGQVLIVNSAGVLFSRGSRVNAGGLVASTHDVSKEISWPATTPYSGTSNAAGDQAGPHQLGGNRAVAYVHHMARLIDPVPFATD